MHQNYAVMCYWTIVCFSLQTNEDILIIPIKRTTMKNTCQHQVRIKKIKQFFPSSDCVEYFFTPRQCVFSRGYKTLLQTIVSCSRSVCAASLSDNTFCRVRSVLFLFFGRFKCGKGRYLFCYLLRIDCIYFSCAKLLL